MSGLVVRDLGVVYRGRDSQVSALEHVNLAVGAGERLAIVGESGSGKSTLALAIADLLPPRTIWTGTVDWQGSSRPPAHGREAGFVFQDPQASFDPLIAVGRQLVEARRALTGEDAGAAKAAAMDLLRRVGFPEPELVFPAFAHQLSGGQAQRVAIACALAGSPSLLIADEPTSALDTIVQAEIVGLINGLVAANALSLIFVTHDLALAKAMGDRIAVMHDGRLLQVGRFDEVFAAPDDSYVARLRGAYLDLDAVL